MNHREIEETRWNRPEAPVDEDIMSEGLRILESVDENRNFLDVVNWNEKAEMDKISKKHGISPSEFGDYDDGSGQQINERHRSENPKEQELMDDLAGIMGAMEELDEN